MLGSYFSFLRISISEARRVRLISDLSILRSMTLTATGVSDFKQDFYLCHRCDLGTPGWSSLCRFDR